MKLKVTQPPECPVCAERMERYDLPPVTFSDGLGWGAPFLWVCPSDDCPVFRDGFENLFHRHGQPLSMRSIIEPDSGRAGATPTFSFDRAHFETFLRERHASKKEFARRRAERLAELNEEGISD